MIYTAKAFGWMTIMEAPTAREALRIAKARAGSASLLSSDVTSVRPATEDDIHWYGVMCGSVRPDKVASEASASGNSD